MLALVWVLASRLFGPSDIWHQTQPRTVSYTTDIIVHGGNHWILPLDRGEFPATKPPLYNWLAVPAVKLLGFSSEIAHKFPSLVAMMLCWLILVRLGNRIDIDYSGESRSGGARSGGGIVGWLAGMMFLSNYTIFKLGYLARPDMLLTFWMLLAWISATATLKKKGVGSLFLEGKGAKEKGEEKDSRPLFLPLVFWLSIALGGLTKGPPVIVALVYALFAARLIGGSWRSINRLGWWWGLPLSLALIGLWLYGVWLINPEHLRQELWFNEIYGRMTGQGPNVDHRGVVEWLKGIGTMPAYYIVRFAPWSILSLLTTLWVLGREKPQAVRRWRELPDETRPWIIGAILFIVLTVGLFSLSAGKRADYIAAAFAPGSLLASWWLVHLLPRAGLRLPWLAPLMAAVMLGAMTIVNQLQPNTKRPIPGFADNIARFIDASSRELAAHPAEVGFSDTGHSHFMAFIGFSEPDSLDKIETLIAAGKPFWIFGGRTSRNIDADGVWHISKTSSVKLSIVIQSDFIPGDELFLGTLRERGWPVRMTLYHAEPRPAPPRPPGSGE